MLKLFCNNAALDGMKFLFCGLFHISTSIQTECYAFTIEHSHIYLEDTTHKRKPRVTIFAARMDTHH